MSRFSSSPGIAVRSWSGESTAAVFVADTVSTHLVNEAAAAFLKLASVHPVTIEEALASLLAPRGSVDSGLEGIESDSQLIDEITIGLVAAGLLRRVE